MPMEDVGRLLDTLDDGYAEATGEQPAVPAADPGTEVMPGTGTYHRPPQHAQQPPPPALDERPTASLSPNDVLVARGPAPQDKLVASYSETTGPRETPSYGERTPFTGPQYVEQPAAQYPGDPHSGPHYTGDPFSGPQYTGDPLSGPQYTGDAFSGPQYTGDPLSGPQYTGDPLSGPQYAGDPFTGPQYVDSGEPVYQLPAGQRRPAPLSTDPLGFPSQAADPFPPAQQYSSDSYGSYQQPPSQPQPPSQAQPQSTAGLGTPMHGIPGAGRRRNPAPAQDSYRAADTYQGYQQPAQPNPVDPLLALGRQEYPPQSSDPNMGRPYVTDPLFSTGERLRPDQQQDYGDGHDRREW
ncbi:hypothetical protein [Nonomuraea sp. NPDC001831]|uniref:hypothetical protein n=1 Tax=Nonomuraea sp. NPDC001831 TaxID=3364340 RepID=UPI0036BC86D1